MRILKILGGHNNSPSQTSWCPDHCSTWDSSMKDIWNFRHKIKHETCWPQLQASWQKKSQVSYLTWDWSPLLSSTRVRTLQNPLSIQVSWIYSHQWLKKQELWEEIHMNGIMCYITPAQVNLLQRYFHWLRTPDSIKCKNTACLSNSFVWLWINQ